MSNRIISMRPRERKTGPVSSFGLNPSVSEGLMTSRSLTTTVAIVLALLVVIVGFLGLAKTAFLLAKIYLAIFALLFLAASVTGMNGARRL